MVKFSKELEAQLIPEWREKFVNYWQLKKDVKKIKLLRKAKQYQNSFDSYYHNSIGPLAVFGPILNPIRRLTEKISDGCGSFAGRSSDPAGHAQQQQREMTKVIKSNHQSPRNKLQAGTDSSEEEEGDTDQERNLEVVVDLEDESSEDTSDLVQLFSEEDAVDRFFDRLDDELKKVNSFYTAKETELVERGEALYKQLQTLLDVKRCLFSDRRSRRKNRYFWAQMPSNGTSSPRSARMSDASLNGSMSDASDGGTSDTTLQSQAEEVMAVLERNGVSFMAGISKTTANNNNNKSTSLTKLIKGKPRSTSIRIDLAPAQQAVAAAPNPMRTISTAMTMLWEDLVNNLRRDGASDFINRRKIQCAEKMIRSAYVELYRGLGFLKTYSSLNIVAFTKILKKFDKVANQQESPGYLKKVKESHFISSDKVVRQMDEVESLFTQHFAENDRKKAMKFLRPQQQKDSHMLSFLVGLFTGCFVTLFIVYALLAHIAGIFSPQSKANYVETMYPVFSMFALLSLHTFIYGCNLFWWKATRINNNFIFEFSPKTALKHRDAFLICTSTMTTVIAAMVVHLLLKSSGFPPNQVDALPGIMLLVFLVLLFCPVNILYRPTRFCFLRVIRNIICSPFYKVLMVDFFMADQLTSQIPLLRHMETTTCYFLAGCFKTHHFETCKAGKLYRELAYVISFAPYFWRAMQCARRWFDEANHDHLYNLGKYVSAMVAAGVRLTYSQQLHSHPWLIAVVVTSIIATIYQLYWDFVMDWGILKKGSKNPWLRDNLILKNKCVYYISIALNMVLRVAWVESVLSFKVGSLESRMLDFILASLEVIRRGHWNFYRLENEHLNNVGQFRALKTVPLPFRGIDSD